MISRVCVIVLSMIMLGSVAESADGYRNHRPEVKHPSKGTLFMETKAKSVFVSPVFSSMLTLHESSGLTETLLLNYCNSDAVVENYPSTASEERII